MTDVAAAPQQGQKFDNLQAWMEHHKVNTTELARRCKISKAHLSMILRGSRRPSFYKAMVIWEVVERAVPIDRLIQWPPVPLQQVWREVTNERLITVGKVA